MEKDRAIVREAANSLACRVQVRRVTHVMAFDEVDGIPPFSGAENHLFILMQAQRRSGLHVELLMLVLHDGPLLKAKRAELQRRGIKVFVRYITPKKGRIPRFVNSRATLNLFTFFRHRKTNIIHTHLELADRIGKVGAYLAGCRHIISSIHNDSPFYTDLRWQICLRAMDRITSHYIAISDRVRQHLKTTLQISDSRITVIYYGIDFPSNIGDKNSLRKRFGLPIDKFIVGFVGRLTEQKNLDVLIEAMQTLPSAHAVLVGEGDMGNVLREKVINARIPNIHFLGPISNAQEIMPAFDIFCLPSKWEGLGLVLLEAMARKVGIIGSTAGAIPEILGHGKFGILFNPQDVFDLKRAIQYAIDNPDRVRQITRDSYYYAANTFMVERMVKQTLCVYDMVINS